MTERKVDTGAAHSGSIEKKSLHAHRPNACAPGRPNHKNEITQVVVVIFTTSRQLSFFFFFFCLQEAKHTIVNNRNEVQHHNNAANTWPPSLPIQNCIMFCLKTKGASWALVVSSTAIKKPNPHFRVCHHRKSAVIIQR